jgi:hypothetical protein
MEWVAMTNDDEYEGGGGDDDRFCFILSRMRLL